MELTPTGTLTAIASSPQGRPHMSTNVSTAINSSVAKATKTIPKPKQSKSRNGCSTCKAKRLKCDETKPSCRQCERRKVTCGGYQKDFKWRSFGKSSFTGQRASKGKHVTAVPPGDEPSTSAREPPAPSAPPVSDKRVCLDKDEQDRRNEMRSPGHHQLQLALDLPDDGYVVTWDLDDEISPGRSEEADFTSVSAEPSPNPGDDVFSDAHTIDTTTSGLDEPSPTVPFSACSPKAEDEVSEEVAKASPIDTEDVSWDPMHISSPDFDLKDITFDTTVDRGLLFPTDSPEMLLMRFDRRTCGILSLKDGLNENPWRTLVWPLAADSPSVYHAICSLSAFHHCKAEPELRVRGVDHMRQSIKTLARDIRGMRTDAALATTLALAFAESWDKHISSGIQHLCGARALLSQALAYQQRHALSKTDLALLRFLYNTWTYASVIARLTSSEDVGLEELPFSPVTGPASQIHEIDPLMGCAATLFPLIGRVASLVRKVRNTTSNSIALISQAIELKTLIKQWEPPKYFEPPEDPTCDVQHCYQTALAYREATLLHLHQAVPEMPSEPSAEMAKRVLVLLATVPLSSRATVVHIYPLLVASCDVETEEDRNWVRERWAALQSRLMIGNIDRCLEIVEEVWARRDEFALRNLGDQRVSFVAPMDTMRKRNTMDGKDAIDSAFFGFSNLQTRRYSANDVDSVDLQSPSRSMSASPRAGSVPLDSVSDSIEGDYSVRGSLHWVGVMKDWDWEVLLG